MTSRRERFTTCLRQLRETGVAAHDPVRGARMALLELEQLELSDLRKGVIQSPHYYDMALPEIMFDSPSQHSTPCTPLPFTPQQSPLTPQTPCGDTYATHQHKTSFSWPIMPSSRRSSTGIAGLMSPEAAPCS